MNGYPWLKNSIYDKMFNLSSNEISFLLYLVRMQNESGNVYGVHYKNVSENIFVSVQTFYTVLRSLEEKGFIRYTKNHYTDYDITIIGNDFTKASERKSYIVVTSNLFKMPEFHSLRAGEKLLAIYVQRYYDINHQPYTIGAAKFMRKWQGLLKVSSRILKGYIYKLKKLHLIYASNKNDKYYMSPVMYTTKNDEQIADRKQCHKNVVGVLCRRNRIKQYSLKALEDCMTLIDQYAKKAKEAGKDIIDCLDRAIKITSMRFKSGYMMTDDELEPKYIHALLKNIIAEAN